MNDYEKLFVQYIADMRGTFALFAYRPGLVKQCQGNFKEGRFGRIHTIAGLDRIPVRTCQMLLPMVLTGCGTITPIEQRIVNIEQYSAQPSV